MNTRKPSDYSSLYSALDVLMGSDLTEMELYCEIGRAVCARTEKGSAVMAAEYLQSRYPERKGFSPRNLRRMRLFYLTYGEHTGPSGKGTEAGVDAERDDFGSL